MRFVDDHDLVFQTDPQGLASVLLQQKVVRQRHDLHGMSVATIGL